jgi:hypothetical protein
VQDRVAGVGAGAMPDTIRPGEAEGAQPTEHHGQRG